MWLCTQHGFYSIVQKAPDEFHVRARLRLDLANLRTLCRAKWKIHESPGADYRWRAVVAADDVALIMSCLGESIDYGTFTGRIHERPDQAEKSAAYGQLWASLYRLQEAV
jgi:hypothetical protein